MAHGITHDKCGILHNNSSASSQSYWDLGSQDSPLLPGLGVIHFKRHWGRFPLTRKFGVIFHLPTNWCCLLFANKKQNSRQTEWLTLQPTRPRTYPSCQPGIWTWKKQWPFHTQSQRIFIHPKFDTYRHGLNKEY